MTAPFDYPAEPHRRRHGPRGYLEYESCREWLRDEFAFRCIFCLHRERWVTGGFHLDHFVPVSVRPDLATEYDNLLYCCSTCNLVKNQLPIPDPTQFLLAGAVTVNADGSLTGTTPESLSIIEQLRLNQPRFLQFRRMWMAIVETLRSHPEVSRTVLSFPDDLPELATRRPPDGNTKPQGIAESYSEQRQRGELPECY